FLKAKTKEKQKLIAAYQKGQDAGRSMAAAVDEYMDRRLPSVTAALLKVFADRLQTIFDEPEHDPKVVAAIELKIFKENTDTFQTRLKNDFYRDDHKWIEVAKLTGVLDLIDQHIDKRTEAAL